MKLFEIVTKRADYQRRQLQLREARQAYLDGKSLLGPESPTRFPCHHPSGWEERQEVNNGQWERRKDLVCSLRQLP